MYETGIGKGSQCFLFYQSRSLDFGYGYAGYSTPGREGRWRRHVDSRVELNSLIWSESLKANWAACSLVCSMLIWHKRWDISLFGMSRGDESDRPLLYGISLCMDCGVCSAAFGMVSVCLTWYGYAGIFWHGYMAIWVWIMRLSHTVAMVHCWV